MTSHSRIIYDYALQFVGTPYRWGGDSVPAGFDCSGLVLEVLKAAGEWPLKEDTTAQGIFDHFKDRSSHDVRHFASLYFYGASQRAITHVAFGLSPYLLLEAGGGGSATVNRDVAAKQNAAVRIRPVSRFRSDLVAVLLPSYSYIGVM